MDAPELPTTLEPQPAPAPRSAVARLLPVSAFAAGIAIAALIFGVPEHAAYIAGTWLVIVLVFGVFGNAIQRRWSTSDEWLAPLALGALGGPTLSELGWGKGLAALGMAFVVLVVVGLFLDDD